MQIRTKRFDKDIPLPEYEDMAAGFDFVCREEVTIEPGETGVIPANVAMEIPDGYVLIVAPRSSTHARHGLLMPHSIGVVDPFYHGDDNEIVLVFHNFSKEKAVIKRGDRIAQGILVKFEKVEFDEVEKLGDSRIKGSWKSSQRE